MMAALLVSLRKRNSFSFLTRSSSTSQTTSDSLWEQSECQSVSTESWKGKENCSYLCFCAQIQKLPDSNSAQSKRASVVISSDQIKRIYIYIYHLVCDSACQCGENQSWRRIFSLSHTKGYIRRPQRHKLESYNYTWVNRWQVGVGISLSPAGTSLQIKKRSACGWCYNSCGGGGGGGNQRLHKKMKERRDKASKQQSSASGVNLPDADS